MPWHSAILTADWKRPIPYEVRVLNLVQVRHGFADFGRGDAAAHDHVGNNIEALEVASQVNICRRNANDEAG